MATIGSVQSQRVAQQPFSPAQKPSALGGLGDSLLRLSNVKAEQSESLLQFGEAEQNLQEKFRSRAQNLEKAKSLVEFNRLQGEWTREAVEIETAAAADGSDLEQKLAEGFQNKFGGYIAGLPEHMQNQMLPAFETYKQSEQSTAFGKRLGMEGKAYIGGLQELQTSMMDGIFTGEKTAADYDQVIDEYLAASPLPQAETDALRTAARKQLQELEFLTRATDEFVAPVQSRGGSTAGGMPAVANKLGNAIAGVESGGDYNIMYSPNGRREFTDFSKHPNQPATIASGPNAGQSSTAAGKYQFINGTWEYVAAEIGAEDFGPANQERGMWFLAQTDYKKRTGRDLQSDLESGSPLLLAAVRKNLAGTWEGLKHMTDSEFIAAMGAPVTATPPSVMDDPAFDALSEMEKFDLASKAQENAAAQRAAELKAASDRNSALMQTMLQDIQAGNMTAQLLEQTALENNFTYEETEKLRTARGKHQAGQVAIEDLSKALVTPGALFGEKEKEGMEALYGQEGKAEIANKSAEYVAQTVYPLVDKTGIIPKGLAEDLSNMRASSDPTAQKYAFDTMSGLYAINPGLFGRTFSEDAASDMLFYQSTANYLPEEERIAELRRRNSPEFKAGQAQLRQAIQTEFASNPKDFSPLGIAAELNYEGEMDSMTASSLSRDFNALYEREYLKTGNHKLAKEATNALLATRWGTVELGGQSYLMENPPDKSGVMPIAGSMDWLDTVVRQTLPELADKPYRLGSDAQTEAERNAGKPPSYLVQNELFPNIFVPMLGPDNLPLRINFDEPELQMQLSTDSSLWNRKDQANTALMESFVGVALLRDDPVAKELAGLLVGVDQTLRSSRPSIVKEKPPVGWDGIAVPTPERQKQLLDQMGYPSLEDFIDDLPMMDYTTMRSMLEE